ncbi:Uncharacterised protein [Burkholderia pseudomallei]|nr:Uncharacterised protein [Burkholderia pseudomallei]
MAQERLKYDDKPDLQNSECDEVGIDELRERHPLARGERMIDRRDGDQPILAKRHLLESVEADRIRDDPEIGGLAANRMDDLLARALLDAHRQLRVARQVFGERVGQVFAERGGVAEQANVAAQPRAELLQLAAHMVDLLQHDARVMLERAAGFGRARAALRAL